MLRVQRDQFVQRPDVVRDARSHGCGHGRRATRSRAAHHYSVRTQVDVIPAILRDIGWTSHSYKLYVDGALVADYVLMPSLALSINELAIFSYTTETSYWDEIVFY
jgi:hypothetical protein